MAHHRSKTIPSVLAGVVLLVVCFGLAAAMGAAGALPDHASSPVASSAPPGDADSVTRAPILDSDSSRLSIQGRLTDGFGIPVSDGMHTLDVHFYDSEVGGLLIDSVVGTSVATVNGIFSARIGPVDPAIFDGTARWMAFAVDGDDVLPTRVPLTAVPYAFRVNRVASEELDDAIALGSPVESGHLAIFGGQATPTFTVDADLNTASIRSDDDTGSAGMIAENGAGYVAAMSNNRPGAFLDGHGAVWAETNVSVGDLSPDFSNNVQHAALQSGLQFGGRLLTWDTGEDLTAMIGSSAGRGAGGVLQLYRGAGGVSVEIDGEDGNGNGHAIWRNADSDTTVEISAVDHRIYTYGADNAEHARLGGSASGNLQLRGGGPSNPLTVNLNAGIGGQLDLYDTGGADLGVRLEGGTSAGGGHVRVYNAGTTNTIDLNGNLGGSGAGAVTVREGSQDAIVLDGDNHRIQVFDPADTETIRLFGNGGGGGGGASFRNSNGDVTVEIDGDDNNDSPALRVIHADGTNVFYVNANGREAILRGGRVVARNMSAQDTAELDGDANGSGGALRLRRPDGTLGVRARAVEGTGAELNIYNDLGQASIQLDTDWNGNGQSRIVANEFQITGGSDLAEQFDVSATKGHVEPGMVVCIDPTHPGKLAVCDSAYDSKVAGIVSGANGVKTGMYMGQHGSEADGQFPVALTGRVYCQVDAASGAVRAGDLLTTSDRPGYAMRVSDPQRAHGAIIGKAMTELDGGSGVVLVLVTLH